MLSDRRSLIVFVATLATACTAKADPIQTPPPEQVHMLDHAGPNDKAERTRIDSAVKAAIDAEDFAALNKMEREFRTGRGRVAGGMWKLGVYHMSLQYHLQKGITRDEGCVVGDMPFLQRWKAADPTAPAATITEAANLVSAAWCIRGTGFAASVSSNSWQPFRSGIAQAEKLLTQNRDTMSVDPEFYTVISDIYRAQGRSRDEFDAMIDEASTREPAYQNTYFHAAWYFMPQWGGSLEEFDQFAKMAAQRSSATDRTGMYARIYWHFEDCQCSMIKRAADWPFFKQSMRDIWALYPVEANGNFARQITCALKDEDEGLHYIRALCPEATSDGDLVARIAACKFEGQRTG